jgi:hypothetical protein
MSGGQLYWPDEDAIHPRELFQALIHRDWENAFQVLDRAEHPLFKVVGVVPAAIEAVTTVDARVHALFFSMASVVSIWLMNGIAGRLGATEFESLMAAAALALASSFFYWSRHVQPYDLSMMLSLLAIYVGLGPRPLLGRAVSSGVLLAASFLCYPGYWTSVFAAVVIAARERTPRWREALGYAVVCAAALGGTLGIVIAANGALGGHLLESFLWYAGTIDQGAYDEGWRLPIEYLWHAEHLLVVLWLGSTAWCLAAPRRMMASGRVRAGLFGLVIIYGAFVMTSVMLHKFVVYGRLARQLVPFFCLVTAAALQDVRHAGSRLSRRLVYGVMAAAIAQAAVNFAEPLTQSFPVDFVARFTPTPAVAAKYRAIVRLNTQHMYPGPPPIELPAHYVTLAEARHPLQFLPYQYEGYTRPQREAFRTVDITMRLLGVLP